MKPEPEQSISPNARPMSVNAFCRMWRCEAEWTWCLNSKGKPWWSSIYIWEPLDTDAPADAKPYCYLREDIDFYDSTGNTLLDKHVRHYSFGFPPDMVFIENCWWEIGGGRVVYRNGRWYFRHKAWRNSRLAYMMNHGRPAYQDSDIALRWSYKLNMLATDIWVWCRRKIGGRKY